jgi:ATP-dependent DNA helicase PIF1
LDMFGYADGHCFWLSGSAGTGKTHTLNTLYRMCHARGIPIMMSASTGIAATRLTDATTAHSLFGIRVDKDDANELSSMILCDSYKGQLLKKVRIFVIDEVGMLNVKVIRAIDTFLRDLHSCNQEFGGVIVIFTGDERQIMPVMGPRVDPLGDEQAEATFFFSDYAHRELTHRCYLTQNMRLNPRDTGFRDYQDALGVDRVKHVPLPDDPNHKLNRYINVRPEFARTNELDFVREVFPPTVFTCPDPMTITKHVVLASINATVDHLNAVCANLMPADRVSRTYLSTNVAGEHDRYNPENAIYSAQNMQNTNSADIPHHSLTLKAGMPVMYMKNTDVSNGLANGAMMVVTRLDADIVWCLVSSRHGVLETPIIPTEFEYDNNNGFTFKRTQLPLRVAFAVTIHRSQGGTYDRVGLHAVHQIWYHGGLFVAFTRCTSQAGFTIYALPRPGMNNAVIRNVVHPRISRMPPDCVCGCNPLPPGLRGPPPPPPPPPVPQVVVDEDDVDEDIPFMEYER